MPQGLRKDAQRNVLLVLERENVLIVLHDADRERPQVPIPREHAARANVVGRRVERLDKVFREQVILEHLVLGAWIYEDVRERSRRVSDVGRTFELAEDPTDRLIDRRDLVRLCRCVDGGIVRLVIDQQQRLPNPRATLLLLEPVPGVLQGGFVLLGYEDNRFVKRRQSHPPSCCDNLREVTVSGGPVRREPTFAGVVHNGKLFLGEFLEDGLLSDEVVVQTLLGLLPE